MVSVCQILTSGDIYIKKNQGPARYQKATLDSHFSLAGHPYLAPTLSRIFYQVDTKYVAGEPALPR